MVVTLSLNASLGMPQIRYLAKWSFANVQKVMPTAHLEVIKGQWADQNYCEKGGIYSIKTPYRLLRGRGLMSLQYMRTPDEGRSMEDRFENKSHFGFRRVRS